MKLTELQKETVRGFSEELKGIIRQQQQDPASFDNHVVCLKALEQCEERFLDFLLPYISKQVAQGDKLLSVKWNMFNRLKIRSELKESEKVLTDIYSLFFDRELIQLIKSAFSGQPVTRLNVDIDEKLENSRKGTFFVSQEADHKHAVSYKITFLDGSELVWHSMDDAGEMERARRIFEEKVPQPATASRCGCVLM